MKQILWILIPFFIMSCGTSKSTQKAISSGNYDSAIRMAVSQLQKNKTRKGNQEYIYMLEEAFAKAVDRDESRIDFLKKDGNPAHLEEVYNTFKGLDQRQELIRPLLPLTYYDSQKQASFAFRDYTDEMIKAKNELSEYLYQKALAGIDTNNKNTLRAIYNDLSYLDRINPSYKDVPSLMDDVHARGTDYVFVSLKNTTDQVIPKRLEEDLLNFDTYGLDDLWTVYHSTAIADLNYDFDLQIDFRALVVSPEQIREKELVQERSIKDGTEYVLDENGERVKDSLGNEIQVDRMIQVRSVVLEIRQFKSTDLTAAVQYINNSTQQVIETFPLTSSYLFEHYYATHSGDRRALDQHYRGLVGLAAVPFPSNEQMIYDAGQDLKWRVKEIITQNSFR